jgi:hypothetical protein
MPKADSSSTKTRPDESRGRSGREDPPTALSPSQAPYTRPAGKTRISRSTWFSFGTKRPK